MDSAVTDIFGSARGAYDRMMPAMGGASDPAFSMLLDQTASRGDTAPADDESSETEDAGTEATEGDSRPVTNAGTAQPDPALVGKKKTSDSVAVARTKANEPKATETVDAARPITVEAAQVRFATAEDALPIPSGDQSAVVQTLAAGNGAAVAGTANVTAQSGKGSDTLKSAEDFVLGRRAHLLDANATHAEQARAALTRGKGANAGNGKADAGAAGTPATAAKAAATDGSGAQAARAGSDAPAATVGDRPATTGSQPQTASAPTPASAANAAANPALAAANAAPTFADTMRANTTARSDAATGSVDPGAAAGTQRQPAQAAAAKSAAARPGPNTPLPRPAEQLSVQIRHAAANGNERISVKLTPASLGHVEVKLELAPDKTVHAVVTADRPETLDMLERDARVLQRALEDAGLKTGSDSLSFAQRDSGQATADGQGSSRSGTATPGGESADEQIALADQPAQSRRAHDGVLDLEI